MSVPLLRQGRRSWSSIVLAVLLVVAVSCGDDSEPTAASTTSSSTAASATATTDETTSTTAEPTTTTSAVPVSPEQEVIDRYVGFWNARFEANSGTPDPSFPGLAEYATGAQLDNVIAETERNLAEGLALAHRDDPASFQQVRVISIDGDIAVVQECFVDDGLVIRRATGEVVDDSITTQNVQGTLERVDGRWKVARAQLLQESEGVSGCALAS